MEVTDKLFDRWIKLWNNKEVSPIYVTMIQPRIELDRIEKNSKNHIQKEMSYIYIYIYIYIYSWTTFIYIYFGMWWHFFFE